MSSLSSIVRPLVLSIAGFIAVMSSSISPLATAQATVANEWTWMGGSSQGTEPAGVYGKLGVAAAENTPGGRQ